ncbi:MAG: DUF1974 domain-containing protein [Oligoflexus sp.]|nr:DUF1974 domain-containing protein [Oligoflexus sp.]
MGSYAATRKQFGLALEKFEGIDEPLSRIAGLTYLLEASRIFTVGAVDSGIKPAVVSAIAKYNSTEIGRILINDGMDVLAGAGISRGPRNLIANNYIGTTIGITDKNIELPYLSWIFRGPVGIWSRFNSFGSLPNDRLSNEIAHAICRPGELREAMAAGIYVPTEEDQTIARYESTIVLMHAANAV